MYLDSCLTDASFKHSRLNHIIYNVNKQYFEKLCSMIFLVSNFSNVRIYLVFFAVHIINLFKFWIKQIGSFQDINVQLIHV